MKTPCDNKKKSVSRTQSQDECPANLRAAQKSLQEKKQTESLNEPTTHAELSAPALQTAATDAALRRIINPGGSSACTVYSLSTDIGTPQGKTIDATRLDVIRTILAWIQDKFPEPLTAEASEGESFLVDVHGQQQAECIAIPEDCVWCLRIVQPDTVIDGLSAVAVAGRTWTSDIAIRWTNDQLWLDIRVMCVSTAAAKEYPVPLTRPRIVRDLTESDRYSFRDVRYFNQTPWVITTRNNVDELHDLIENQQRMLPVIILCEKEPVASEETTTTATLPERFSLDPNKLARRLVGYAHVACLTASRTAMWTKRVGEEWAVAPGGLRIYLPHLNWEEDRPTLHSQAVPNQLWQHGTEQIVWDAPASGSAKDDEKTSFSSILLEVVRSYAAKHICSWDKTDLVFVPESRSRRSAIRREQLQAAASLGNDKNAEKQLRQLKEAHAEEVENLNREIQDWKALAYDVTSKVEKALSDADLYRDKFNREKQEWQGRIQSLEAARKEEGRDIEPTIPILDTYEGMSDWVKNYLAGRLIFHPRADGECKDAKYEDVELVYRALLLLATHHVDMKRGVAGAKEAWEQELSRLGLKHALSISKGRAGEQGKDYFVKYPLGFAHDEFLKFHLVRGDTKDDRFCLRIYFFWDDENKIVVVGSLPRHLDTRAT